MTEPGGPNSTSQSEVLATERSPEEKGTQPNKENQKTHESTETKPADLAVVPGVPKEELHTVAGVRANVDTTTAQHVTELIAENKLDEAILVAQNQVEKPTAELYRETLIAHAQQSSIEHGYQPDAQTAPYKSFGNRERFYIQKCISKDGETVVVKVAAPERQSKEALHREITVLQQANNALESTIEHGKNPQITFPKIIDSWKQEENIGLVTEFIPDSKDTKRSMTGAGRGAILKRAIEGLHQIEIPDSFKENGPRVLDGNAHAERAKRFLDRALKNEAVSKEEAENIAKLFEDSIDLIDQFPQKLSHGDLHAENIAYEKNEDGTDKLTIMDLEALRINNEFFDWATMANLSSLGRFVESHQDAFAPILDQLQASWIDGKSAELESMVEQDVIEKHPKGDDAMKVFRLMRIMHVLEKMGIAGNDALVKLNREAAGQILRDQLSKLNS
ncbi:hypothetical protein A2318_03105 [Candidatus Uhrbacteria bacterium RIFOXYB2_FULL_45_11]|uniref:Aminoglycoside phosphotransferase domain-containing protein n=1 Tax=Candidatus Uhrbacteria bacterium RIFOXYB2_FULL_45_11 TaxID=1802421 RepID=A0A1F7W7Z5_9BACT|nr:MAG: hypothetical protein A2318_03105 [Candidatus Uhrbacteria bacterium RIFOXYB2_FULL_45_11]